MELFDPGFAYLRPGLDALVEAYTITREDADHYIASLRAAPRLGEPIVSGTIYKMGFRKKSV